MKNDGGPMFPWEQLPDGLSSKDHDQASVKRYPGISIRTWLVGQAISGLLPAIGQKAAMLGEWKETWTAETLNFAYEIADEHLRRVEEQQEKEGATDESHKADSPKSE